MEGKSEIGKEKSVRYSGGGGKSEEECEGEFKCEFERGRVRVAGERGEYLCISCSLVQVLSRERARERLRWP